MHIGKRNPQESYRLGDSTLQVTTKEKDLGVQVTSDMKVAEQVSGAAAAANSMLGRIRKTFTCLDSHTLPALYKALVRPRLEYAVQAWSPQLRKDILKLERVQRRATKIVPNLSHLSYEDRLQNLKLTTLEERRHRGDMIEVFKILKGYDKVQVENFLEIEQAGINRRTRGHSMKLKKHQHRTHKRTMFFSARVVNKWNELPDWVVESLTISSFKRNYDKFVSNNQEEAASQ